MRILHVVPTYIPAWRYGGPIRSVHGLCKGLVQIGHDIHVFTTNVDGSRDLDVPVGVPLDIDGVKVSYFPSRRLRRLYWSPPLKKALEQEVAAFDLLHLHSVFLWPTSAAARIAERRGIPYLLAPRGMLVKELIRRKSRWMKTAWLRFVERHTLAQAAALHVTSRREAQEAEELGYYLPPAMVVPNGVDVLEEGHGGPVSARIQRVLHQGPYLLYLGRVSWEKGLDRLISAMSQLPDARLVVAGNAEQNYLAVLTGLAKQHHVTYQISFPGEVNRADKWALLRNALALVLPSYSENFGNAVLEAMGAECPVVVTPEVGLADVIRESGAGLVTAGEPESLARAIRKLTADPIDRERMGRVGKELVRQRFTWETVSRQMEELYEQILTSNMPNQRRAAEQKEVAASARNVAR